MLPPLDPVFRPRSIAVIGASRKRGTIGGEIFHNLVRCGFNGPVYPVNPTAESVQSVRAYRSLAEIPDPVDLAVLVVPSTLVQGAIDECIAKGVRAAVVVTAGFAETGPAGKALQDEIIRRVRAAGMRLVGPNCLGVVNRDPAISMNATFAPVWPPAGGVAIASQSGALGQAILEYARELGIGVSQFIALGNKADISGNDLIEWWEHDDSTRAVLLYLESFGNPRRFLQLARRVTKKKPIMMVKAGRTEAGARAARSHTGALAGLDVAVDALLGQAGVIRTDTIEELFDLAMLFAHQPVPAGRRVAIVTNAGGPGIMASDACESHGLTLPALEPGTEHALRSFLPPEASVRNPVDMIASASADSYRRALQLVLADPNVDAVIALFVPPIVTEAAAVAEAIRDGAAGTKKPVLTCFMGKHGIPEALTSLHAGRLPSYAFPESAAIALARAARHGEWLRRPEGRVAAIPESAIERVKGIIAHARGTTGGRWLTPAEIREIFSAVGIPTLAEEEAQTADEAARIAARIGFPVALKLASDTITHKSDVGGVFLHLADESAVRGAFAQLEGRLTGAGLRAQMRGAIIQAMAPRGVEAFVGVTHDPSFGPLVGFGIGGTQVEVWKDVIFRVCPLGDVEAAEMIEQIRGVKLLDGFRGAKPADRAAIVDTLLRVARLVEEVAEIRELDINPLVVRAPEEGAVVVDARVRVAG